jgi:predicted nucleotidyltransferase
MNIPQLVKKKVLEIDKNAEVILFGSRARGDFREESDWDFLVLSDKEITDEYTWQIVDTLYEIEIETDNAIGSIVRNKTVWKNYVNTHLYKNIEKDGVLI